VKVRVLTVTEGDGLVGVRPVTADSLRALVPGGEAGMYGASGEQSVFTLSSVACTSLASWTGPTQGTIEVDGIDVGAAPEGERAARTGSDLFTMTCPGPGGQ